MIWRTRGAPDQEAEPSYGDVVCRVLRVSVLCCSRQSEGAPGGTGRPFWSRSLMPIRERVNSSLGGGCGLRVSMRERLCDQAGILPNGRFDLRADVRVLLEEFARGLATLADALAVE